MTATVITTDAAGTPTKASVTVQSAWFSKINWGEAVKLAAVALAYFGYELDPQTQVYILQGIVIVGAVYTWAMKTFFTTTVTPNAVTK